MGDSKSTTANGLWGSALIDTLNANNYPDLFVSENKIGAWRDWAVGGFRIFQAADSIDTWLARHTVQDQCEDVFLINFGTNDMYYGTDSLSFVTDYLYVLDAIHAKYTTAKLYITKPWRQVEYLLLPDTISDWIDVIIASRSTFAFAGDDERVWLEGGDDGATNTRDGTHYSTAGQVAKINAIRTVLGY